jgi:hypothetical protein
VSKDIYCWTLTLKNFILARSVKFEEESVHDFSEDPAEEPFVVTDEEESETS